MSLTSPLSSINWRYAIGEVLLIAIGVLIALAASNWQSDRAARRTEIAVLKHIAASLAEDREQVMRWCKRLQLKEASLLELQAHLQARQPYIESLDALFGALYGFTGPSLNKAAYESLKSQGMGLISNSFLRNGVSEVYEKTYASIEYNAWLSRSTVLDALRPYYLQNFRDIRFHTSATPIDYEKVLSDVLFRNLLDYRLLQIQGVHLPVVCNSAPQEMDNLQKAIAVHAG